MKKILLVEDDEALAMATEFSLMEEGYTVKHVLTVEDAKYEINNNDYDLAILDINLPDGNGYDICKFIKKTRDIPVIFLTALDEEVNVVLGLEIGGEDYITKPFRIREFLSRIKVVLRRSNRINKNRYLKSGDLVIDTLSANIIKNNKIISITSQEYKLLLGFLHNPKVILSKQQLLNIMLGGEGNYIDENALSVYIKRLRDKIENDTKYPEYIINKRGMGYEWAKEVEGVN